MRRLAAISDFRSSLVAAISLTARTVQCHALALIEHRAAAVADITRLLCIYHHQFAAHNRERERERERDAS